MKRKTLLAGILCGVVCAVCVLLYLNSVRGQAEADRAEALQRYGGEQIVVCVATRDISPGEIVDLTAVETKLWVADLLPEDVVTKTEDALGKQATSRILQGEAISLKRFEDQSYALDIPAGLTAVSVPAKEVQAVGGAIGPSSRVDIFATGNATTRLLASSVLVLATSVSASKDSSGTAVAWITVAVEPEMVEELVAAAQGTQLYFTLPGGSAEKTSAEATGTGRDNGGGAALQQSAQENESAQRQEDGSSASRMEEIVVEHYADDE